MQAELSGCSACPKYILKAGCAGKRHNVEFCIKISKIHISTLLNGKITSLVPQPSPENTPQRYPPPRLWVLTLTDPRREDLTLTPGAVLRWGRGGCGRGGTAPPQMLARPPPQIFWFQQHKYVFLKFRLFLYRCKINTRIS